MPNIEFRERKKTFFPIEFAIVIHFFFQQTCYNFFSYFQVATQKILENKKIQLIALLRFVAVLKFQVEIMLTHKPGQRNYKGAHNQPHLKKKRRKKNKRLKDQSIISNYPSREYKEQQSHIFVLIKKSKILTEQFFIF